jgi:hypothetical protein
MFKEVPASKSSITKRKLIYGVGINDADYFTSAVIDGKDVRCPYYIRWKSMLKRCYSANTHKINKTYIGCTTCDEWKFFSNFKAWMIKQDWEGKHLDKDLLVQGNKVYGPDKCIFVTQAINNLLIDQKKSRGQHAQGVSFARAKGKFIAHCRVNGKSTNIGTFKTEELASARYIEFKTNLIAEIAEQQEEPLRSALLRYKVDC